MRRLVTAFLVFGPATLLSCSEIPMAPRVASVTVSGRITDRDGPPLAGVDVFVQPEATGSGSPNFSYTSTDADGRYALKVSEGIYRLNFYPGYAGGAWPVTLRNVKVGPSGATVDYRYTGFRVTGSVSGPNGDPLTNAEVAAFGLIGTDYVQASSRTVAGQYSLLVPAGVYSIRAASGAYEDGLPRLTLDYVSIASDTTFDFALDGFTVSATFTLLGGTPMIGAHLSAAGDGVVANAITGLDGVATLYLPAGSYRIAASPVPGNVVGPQTIAKQIQGDDALAFDFSGPKWTMTIRRGSDGTPLTGADARLRDGEDGYAADEVDAFGRCEFIVRPGTGYNLFVDWYEGGFYRSVTVPNLFSAADTTFDISVNVPVLP